MDDPFPIKAPAWLVSAVEPYAVQTGLHTLPQHAHEVLLSVLFYTFIGAVASPWLSRRLFPRTYPQLDHRTRTSWDVHTVSLVQSLVINAAALSVIFADDNWAVMGADGRLRLFGYSGELGLVQSLAAGYFIWDVVVSLRHVRKFGWGFVAHALSALFVFSCGFVSVYPCPALPCRPPSRPSCVRLPRSDRPAAASRPQLLLGRLHPLRAFLALPQHPLVLR